MRWEFASYLDFVDNTAQELTKKKILNQPNTEQWPFQQQMKESKDQLVNKSRWQTEVTVAKGQKAKKREILFN